MCHQPGLERRVFLIAQQSRDPPREGGGLDQFHSSRLSANGGQRSTSQGLRIRIQIDSNVRDETANILKTLSTKEEKVIRLRFGIGCEREHTLEEIGQEFDVTRERIRQIEAKALRQLRLPERARHLRALLAAR
jgi:RNA polymerase sigma factor (sigma-70 family)